MANLPITFQGKTYDLADPGQASAYKAAINSIPTTPITSSVSSTGLNPTQQSTLQSIINSNPGGAAAYASANPAAYPASTLSSPTSSSGSSLGQITSTTQSTGGFQNLGGFISGAPSQNDTQSQLGSFNLGGFQTGSTQSNSPTLSLPPIATGGSSSLTDFSNALDAAVNLARESRNAGALGLMQGSQGTVPASSFNSILSNLNAASDQTSSNLINRAITAATPRYAIQQIGDTTYNIQFDANGKPIGADKLFTNPANYSYSTMTDSSGNVFALQTDPNGKPVGQQLIYQAPKKDANSQYTFSTMTDSSTGDVYQVQTDPNSGQIVGQQLLYKGNKTTEVAPGNAVIGQNGQVIYQNPTASVQNQTNGVSPTIEKPIGGAGIPVNVTKSDIQTIEQALLTGKAGGETIGNPVGSDGYIDPANYVQLLNYWIQQGGTKQSFLDKFPVKKYINPANTWVWDQIGIPNPYEKKATSTTSEITNPFK